MDKLYILFACTLDQGLKSNKGTVLLLIHGISDIMHKNVVGDDFAKGSKRKK
jgi:hypothetical protein